MISPETKCDHSLKEISYPFEVHMGQTPVVQRLHMFCLQSRKLTLKCVSKHTEMKSLLNTVDWYCVIPV